MNKAWPILLTLGAIAAGFFIMTATKLKGLIIKLGQISNLQINLDTASIITFTLKVTNPNSKDMTFNGFYGQAFISGKPIATITKINENVILHGKNSTTTLNNLQAKVDAIDLVTQLLEGGAVSVNVQGTLIVDGLKFPVNDTTKLSS